MKVGNFKKYTISFFVCFLSFLGITYAETKIQLGQQLSYSQFKSCNASYPLEVSSTSSGVNITYPEGNKVTDGTSTVSMSCTSQNGATSNYVFTLDNTKVTSVNVAEGKIKAYPGQYGTCGFSGWDSKQYTQSGGKVVNYYETNNSSATLPSCDNSLYKIKDLVEFAGWIPVNNADFVGIIDRDGKGCSANPSLKTGGSSVTSGSWAVCYKQKSLVQLGIDSNLTDFSGNSVWLKDPEGGYYHTGSSPTETIELPSVTLKGFNQGLDYHWISRNGETKKPGERVPLDGSVWVLSVPDASTLTEDRDYNKSVYVNQTVPLVVANIKDCKVVGSTKAKASFVNGECQVTGIEATTGDEKVDVVVSVGEKTVTFKFTVETKIGINQNGDKDFVINVSTNVIFGQNDNQSDGTFATKHCNTFKIVGDPQQSSPFAKDTGGGNMTSALYNVVPTCTDDNANYAAMCLDPGRTQPSGGATYSKTQDITVDTDFGKLIMYLSEKIDPTKFKEPNNDERIAAHVATRVVAIKNGYSGGYIDSVDSVMEKHYKAYESIANALKEGKSVEEAVSQMTITNSNVKTLLIKYLSEYNTGEYEAGDELLRREITDTKVDYINNGKGYVITYTGTMTMPKKAKFEGDSPDDKLIPCGDISKEYGVTCSIEKFKGNPELTAAAKGKRVVDFVVKITAQDASKVVPPKTIEDQINLSYKLNYTRAATIDRIFILEPTGGSTSFSSLQRMLLFNVDKNGADTYVYFSIAPPIDACTTLPSLNSYKECKDAENCPDTSNGGTFNKELFKVTGCCKYVTDEVTYSYVINNICNGKCTASTLSTVCNFDPNKTGEKETYVIKEGASSTSGTEYKDTIGGDKTACVVNVTDKLVNGDSGSSNSKDFEFTDDGGNSRSEDIYKNNRYCRLNCKEDWKISMDSFGNFVGEKAIAAGTYFADNSSVYIKGKRTCYTNFIDYNKYNEEVKNESQKIVDNYNVYYKQSHIYTDIKNQKENKSTHNIEKTPTTACLKYTTCPDGYRDGNNGTCINNADPTDTRAITCEPGSEVTAYTYTLKTNGDVTAGEDDTYSTQLKNSFNEGYELLPKAQGKQDYSTSATIGCSASSSPSSGGTGSYTCDGLSDICDSYSTVNDTQVCTSFNDTKAFDKLAEKMMDDAKAAATSARGAMSAAMSNIYSYSNDLYDCQHFMLFNTTSDISGEDDEQGDGTGGVGSTGECQKIVQEAVLGIKRNYVKVNSTYNPSVSYTYDEDGFMTILGSDNVLEVDIEKMDELTNGEYSKKCRGVWKGDGSDEKGASWAEREDLEPIIKDYAPVTYINPGDHQPWRKDTKEANTYGADGNGGRVQTIKNPSKIRDGSSGITKRKRDVTFCSIASGGSSGGSGGGSGGSSGGHYKFVGGKEGAGYQVWVSGGSSGGGGDPFEWHGGSCYTVEIEYIEAHYIKGSISNGKYYKTKGSWYLNSGDVKEHGDTLEDALMNKAPKRDSSINYKYKGGFSWWSGGFVHGGSSGGGTGGTGDGTGGTGGSGGGSGNGSTSGISTGQQSEYDHWSVLGTGFNVFPISMNTPRNLYQYTYYFGNIGSYCDGTLGRVMGKENSIVSMNSRTCFYEVFEEVCLCCGEEINTHIDDDDNLVEEFLDKTGDNYEYTLSDPSKMNGTNSMDLNSDGTLSFSTSSVALGDLNSDTNRNLGSNWSEKAPFYYNGETYETPKGAELIKEIEAKGETVYAKDYPSEYSYHLTPDTISAIRDFNDRYGYEINYQRLKVYGRYSIVPIEDCHDKNECYTTSDVNKMNNEIANFQHYGSMFLEQFMTAQSGAVNKQLNTDAKNNVCMVQSGFATNKDIKELVDKGCRWIDYVDTKVKDKSGKNLYVRMSFK